MLYLSDDEGSDGCAEAVVSNEVDLPLTPRIGQEGGGEQGGYLGKDEKTYRDNLRLKRLLKKAKLR